MSDFIGISISLLILAALAYVFLAFKYKKIKANWSKLSTQFNLAVTLPKTIWNWSMGDRPFAVGTMEQYNIRCDSVMLGSTDMNTYSRARLKLFEDNQDTFSFYRAGALSRVGKMVGMQDILLDNPAFDKPFIVQASNEDFVKTILTSEIQEILVHKCPKNAYFWFEKGNLNFEISYNDLRNDGQYEEYLVALKIVVLIANQLIKPA